MRRIILSTESGADIPKDLVEKYQIQVVPMHVIMDGKDYLDGELSVEEVFDYFSKYVDFSELAKLFFFNVPIRLEYFWYLYAMLYVYVIFY